MVRHCPAARADELRKGLMGSTGLILSERIVNLPPQLASPLHEALFDEICWATEDEKTAERRKSFEFDQYVLMTQFLTERDLSHAGSTSKKKRKKKAKKEPTNSPDPIYIKLEDEVWAAHSSLQFDFKCKRPVDADDVDAEEENYDRHMKVMVCNAMAVPRVRQQLKQ